VYCLAAAASASQINNAVDIVHTWKLCRTPRRYKTGFIIVIIIQSLTAITITYT